VTFALANVAMTAEVFDRAVAFYDRTRLLTGGNPDAELGYVRALSYARRHAEAIEAANRLLAGSWNRGDAYYWRAWNETQLNQDDRAWDDIAEAAKVLFNADVPKLTGILAIRRGELPRARDQFQQAAARSRDDCEIPSLLGGTHLELESWRSATAALTEAVACLDRRDESLRAEIALLRAAGGRERIVLRREHEIAANERVRVQAWFNLAVAAFEMGDVPAARMYAGRVANDERFGDRARALLQRLQ
jgi:tetratricopeptide (TPR) repeat protein